MFARKVRSVFYKLLPEKNKWIKKKNDAVKFFNPGEKIFLKIYKKNKEYWWKDVSEKRVDRVLYMIKGPKGVHKPHVNQLKKRYSGSRATRLEEPMMVLNDLFNIPIQEKFTWRTRERKRNTKEILDINPKRKKYGLQRK